MNFVSTKDVWQKYGNRSILERVNVTIEEGEFISIVGVSGCGKSTYCASCWPKISPPTKGEIGVDLHEQMTLCDAGDVLTIPANIEKSFDQISRAVSHVFSSGSLPIMIGGDHSIGFPCLQGIAECTSKRVGIVHFDRHADIQEKTWMNRCIHRLGPIPRTCRMFPQQILSRLGSMADRSAPPRRHSVLGNSAICPFRGRWSRNGAKCR